jgi:Glycosyl hydrolase family 3 N terminal domain
MCAFITDVGSDRFCRFPAAGWTATRHDRTCCVSAIDPVAPATLSTAIVGDVIRDSMGFRGLLMSDDISMVALSGSLSDLPRWSHER